jgi:hypothetical protein
VIEFVTFTPWVWWAIGLALVAIALYVACRYEDRTRRDSARRAARAGLWAPETRHEDAATDELAARRATRPAGNVIPLHRSSRKGS